jgi:glycine oxidase
MAVAVVQGKPDVLVVGGGPIGLAAAWRAAQRGLRVLVLDAGEPGAWHVAAGMLAPVAELKHGEEALLELGVRAAAAYPAFCAELAAVTGIDPGLRSEGTLVVARDRDDAEALERLAALHARHDLRAERLLPSAARRAEPALAPTVRLALDLRDDRSVDPRRLVEALRAAVRAAGGEVRAPVRVARVRAGAVGLDDGTELEGGAVVLAAGAAAGNLAPAGAALPVRPVKGQVLRLRDPRGPGLVDRTIRTQDAYLVPRADGRYVLGATMEERGWDRTPTAGGVFELLRDMSEVVPGVLELELDEVLAGLRPATPDNLPALGFADGVLVAAGHHRNGILLAGLTGDLVAGLLCGEPLPGWAAPAAADRFAAVPA